MSFSREVKKELSVQVPEARHCQLAELAAIISHCGTVCVNSTDRLQLKIVTESVFLIRKCFTILEKAFNICRAEH